MLGQAQKLEQLVSELLYETIQGQQAYRGIKQRVKGEKKNIEI